MYKLCDKPDSLFKTEHERFLTPVATLESSYGGRLQIVLDKHCYVIYTHHDRGYRIDAFIRPEVLDVLRTLPNPK
jgi:hypothetical protein